MTATPRPTASPPSLRRAPVDHERHPRYGACVNLTTVDRRRRQRRLNGARPMADTACVACRHSRPARMVACGRSHVAEDGSLPAICHLRGAGRNGGSGTLPAPAAPTGRPTRSRRAWLGGEGQRRCEDENRGPSPRLAVFGPSVPDSAPQPLNPTAGRSRWHDTPCPGVQPSAGSCKTLELPVLVNNTFVSITHRSGWRLL